MRRAKDLKHRLSIGKSRKFTYLRISAFCCRPMIDWTDRHCRFFHRQLTGGALLYTEMIVADAVIHGDRERLLGFDRSEHPVALQLGGSDPEKLAEAAEIGAGFGYDEINLNVGCPSDRVQSGTFGACLMKTPGVVAAGVAAMKARVSLPVTVKCRIGVDDQDTETALDALADAAWSAGADALWVHARKAWLQGLSPRENREIPPLDYNRVYRLKQANPDRFIGINGGIVSLDEAAAHLAHVDGVMLGRAAYQNPAILAGVDALLEGGERAPVDYALLIETMAAYAERHIASGGRLSHVTRHMIGLFHGFDGARRYRQILSSKATKPGAGAEVLREAFSAVDLGTRRDAA
ncbi:tRNA dihydrouridine(20/20a) synthase DusA [Nitratireductor aquibiodomus]|uniref:tRNA dihydrouridine(20/20a) synthase DusA n=1 Tax=Nitratireductor aquibiodomus TaxID=204799 RepID=UPI0009DB6C6E|nr:tRNA dihydrouridine(20/20a) synthase DusA [Nitratireductor aquibiodomus]